MAEVLSQFSGVAGQVLRRALGRSTWISGLALASTLLLAARGLVSAGRPDLFPVVAIPCLMLCLAYHGVRAATVNNPDFDDALGRTVVVASRASLVSAAWLVPWVLWGSSLGRTRIPFESIGAPSPLAAGLYLFSCLTATPVILILALHSRSWPDMLSPAQWVRRFGKHGSDLMTIYTIQTGGAALCAAIVLPLVLGATEFNTTAGIAAAGLGALVILSYWTSLAGRLCGSIYVAPIEDTVAETRRRFDEGMAFAGPALDTGFNRDLVERTVADAPPEEEQEPVAVAVAADAAAGESSESGDAPVNEPEMAMQADASSAQEEVSEAAKITRYVIPSKPVAFDAPKPNKSGRKTPLLDAEARAEEAMKRFRLDPSHTLSKLAELHQNFAPNAHVLQALAICLHRTGHSEQALIAARRAFPLCFERSYLDLAAAMFYEFRSQPQNLDLEQHEILAIAKELQDGDEFAVAAKAYSLVVHANPSEFLAVKGLLDVADGILSEKKKPAAALKVYMFLLEHCKDAGVAEVARDGANRCAAAQESCSDSDSDN